ncbi:hypothetical protein ACROAH_15145 [Shewanella oncorhynchi]|uniref:hypothetical protein n=1 Tax=Shewanella oncorhynchi TaxID=2726434 RepID=UPI003D78C1EE
MITFAAIFYSDLNMLVTASEKCVAITSDKVGFDVNCVDQGELAERLSVWAKSHNIMTPEETLGVI